MSAGKTPGDSVGIPLLGSAGGNLRFELALGAEPLDSREDPFIPLSDSSRFSRVLLGRIASGEDYTVHPVAVKIQRSFYRPAAGGKDTLTNLQIEQLWERERSFLARCGGEDVVPLVDLGESSFRNPPVTFCKKIRAYFHPICPKCRGPLRDCRDDALLRAHDLPEFSRSLLRYLHCAACTASGKGKPVFYTTSSGADESAAKGVEIRRRSELYRDFAAIVNGGLSTEEQARLSESFPCAACLHREECYPVEGSPGKAIPAESRLVPVSYYEFHLIPLEVLELHYDEFADLLGGASWKVLRDRVKQTGAAGREPVLTPIDPLFQQHVQWLYRDDTTGRFPLEVAHLKLSLFTKVCHGARTYHAKTHEPHLDLCPAQVMIDVIPGSTNLPARWTFRVRLVGVAGPPIFPTQGAPAGALPPLLVPAPDADRLFVSPYVKKAEFGREESLRVVVRSVKAEEGRVRIEGSASSDRSRLDSVQPGDVVRLIPTAAVGGIEGLTLWGMVDGVEERGMRFTAFLDAASGFDPAKKPADFDAGVSFFPRFQVPCDLYALGMLFFRTFLVNDAADTLAVDDAVQRILKKLSLWLEGKKAPSAARIAGELLPMIEREREVFGSPSLLFLEEDRQDRSRVLPPRLWSDLLLVGFKLVTSIPGFSFASGHADCPPDRPESVLDQVLTQLDGIETRLRVELFSRADRDREINEICDELLDQLPGGGAP